ncbi:MAG: zinc-dependent metalloprotease [Armatimonadetes bacterium]|nr:zinc-dependent metalloprotease [Armatimonadota bacterium]
MPYPLMKTWILSGLAVAALGIAPLSDVAAAGGPPPPAGAPSTADSPKAEPKKDPKAQDEKKPDAAEAKKDEKKDEKKKDELDDFVEMTKDSEKTEGLFTFYRKKDKLFLELKPEQIERDFIFTITQESGVGVNGVYNGMPINDFLCRFRRVNDQLFFVKRNTSFRAKPGDPVNRSLERAFADSVLVATKLESVHPERKTLLVDAKPFFMGDLGGMSQILRMRLGSGYNFDAGKSYYGTVKSFPKNSELQTYYSFNSGDLRYLETLPDSRNVTLRIHYSISEMPDDGYRPRLADDRLGYFLTAYRDFSNDDADTPFVRYINRWRLEKKDPDAPLSEPKKPITFWLENTIPLEYRDAIRDGVLRWNVAFEKAGFKNAVVVKQQPDDADWDPADIRYNTIRWIHSVDRAFAMGPSTVNPLTGEILDADIVIDGNFIRSVKTGYRLETNQPLSAFAEVFGLPASLRELPSGIRAEVLSGMDGLPILTAKEAEEWRRNPQHQCMMGPSMAQEMGFGATALALRDGAGPGGEIPKEYLDQFWGNLIAHEVGHTIGLRHNFKASTLLSPDQINDRRIAEEKGLGGSVMDYNPANIAKNKAEQGYYYTPTVGPYDVWVIQYGYTPITAASPEGERPALRKIAGRGNEPGLVYATDEDASDMGGATAIDPLVIPYDYTSDPIEYSRRRMEFAKTMLKKLEANGPGPGKSYDEFRRRFGWILGQFNDGFRLSRWIGGSHLHRNHAGDYGEKTPLEPIPAAQQRKALNLIRTYLLAEDAFRFNPNTLNKLAPSRWSHWGQSPTAAMDYPLLEQVEAIQWTALARIYNPVTMRRILNTELRVKNPKEKLTLAEVFGEITDALWSEALTGPARPISPMRRNIQRDQLDVMIGMVLRPANGTPSDARSLARSDLKRLQAAIRRALTPASASAAPTLSVAKGLKVGLGAGPKPTAAPALDAVTRAHLEETDARIAQALTAQVLAQ